MADRGTMWLVHGAGSDPSIFEGWDEHLPSWQLRRADLQAGLDPGTASMNDYVERLAEHLARTPRARVVCGWSMGGLVAMLAATRVPVDMLVVLEPSPPAELVGVKAGVPLTTGVYDPEEEYGEFPAGIAARPESVPARNQRRAGIPVGPLACPLLVVSGRDFPETRGRNVAEEWGGESVTFDDFDHWDLVLRTEVPDLIERWSRRVLAPSRPSPG